MQLAASERRWTAKSVILHFDRLHPEAFSEGLSAGSASVHPDSCKERGKKHKEGGKKKEKQLRRRRLCRHCRCSFQDRKSRALKSFYKERRCRRGLSGCRAVARCLKLTATDSHSVWLTQLQSVLITYATYPLTLGFFISTKLCASFGPPHLGGQQSFWDCTEQR